MFISLGPRDLGGTPVRKTTIVAVMALAMRALAVLAGVDWTAPRTPWGEPDLQGNWTSQAELGVPFERPAAFGTRQTLTDDEFAAREAQAQAQLKSDNADFDAETADTSRAGQVGSATSPPPTWLERGKASRRTSLVIDPPDGRIPPTLPAGLERLRAAGRGALDNGPFDGPGFVAITYDAMSNMLSASRATDARAAVRGR